VKRVRKEFRIDFYFSPTGIDTVTGSGINSDLYSDV